MNISNIFIQIVAYAYLDVEYLMIISITFLNNDCYSPLHNSSLISTLMKQNCSCQNIGF